MPKMAVKWKILVPPLSNRYSLVGTAFDYLMRFYLEYLNPDAVTREWIAEKAFDMHIWDKEIRRKAQWIIDQAQSHYLSYLYSGHITDQLIKSALRLVQHYPIFRTGGFYKAEYDENKGKVYEEDVKDLWNLISIIDPRLFKASLLCLLNPSFGEANRLVGAADADLGIDDAIIDIKTTKNLKLDGRCQLSRKLVHFFHEF